ncbi:hypothetical protein DRN48_08545 [Thermococci archaeon]|nr:MAG: hypothetical protein DRN48_08545 [Thermococci archaeon]
MPAPTFEHGMLRGVESAVFAFIYSIVLTTFRSVFSELDPSLLVYVNFVTVCIVFSDVLNLIYMFYSIKYWNVAYLFGRIIGVMIAFSLGFFDPLLYLSLIMYLGCFLIKTIKILLRG